MQVTSLGFRTDVALRVLEGAQTTDRGDYLVVRTPSNPDFYWGNFLLLGAWPEPGTPNTWLARFAEEFPQAKRKLFRHGRRCLGGGLGELDHRSTRPLPPALAAGGQPCGTRGAPQDGSDPETSPLSTPVAPDMTSNHALVHSGLAFSSSVASG
jgi:hypothetical protein